MRMEKKRASIGNAPQSEQQDWVGGITAVAASCPPYTLFPTALIAARPHGAAHFEFMSSTASHRKSSENCQPLGSPASGSGLQCSPKGRISV